jgi:hypothetical protein
LTPESSQETPNNAPGPDRQAGWTLLGFSLFILAIGLGISYLFIVYPWIKTHDIKRQWQATPCVIVSSSTLSEKDHSSTKTLYATDIWYRYDYEGRSYAGNQVRVIDFLTDNHKIVKKLHKRFPTGKQTICYVNPQQPAEAVLLPEPDWSPLDLIPVAFSIIGLALFLWSVQILRRKNPNAPNI